MWSLCSKICNLQKYFWSGQLKLTTAQHIFSTEMDILEELHNIKLYHQLDSYGQAFRNKTKCLIDMISSYNGYGRKIA